jgi:hypothetical protein
MALTNFLTINMPYGMVRDNNGKWMVFNREYKPIGFNSHDDIPNLYPEHGGDTSKLPLPVYTSYIGLTDRIITEIAISISKDEQGKICRFYLYNDKTSPIKQSKVDKEYWEPYFEKLKKLAKLERE